MIYSFHDGAERSERVRLSCILSRRTCDDSTDVEGRKFGLFSGGVTNTYDSFLFLSFSGLLFVVIWRKKKQNFRTWRFLFFLIIGDDNNWECLPCFLINETGRYNSHLLNDWRGRWQERGVSSRASTSPVVLVKKGLNHLKEERHKKKSKGILFCFLCHETLISVVLRPWCAASFLPI